jgi:hypothetical protein
MSGKIGSETLNRRENALLYEEYHRGGHKGVTTVPPATVIFSAC